MLVRVKPKLFFNDALCKGGGTAGADYHHAFPSSHHLSTCQAEGPKQGTRENTASIC